MQWLSIKLSTKGKALFFPSKELGGVKIPVNDIAAAVLHPTKDSSELDYSEVSNVRTIRMAFPWHMILSWLFPPRIVCS